MQKLIFSIIIYFLLIESSFAYLGPGIGAGILAATMGIVFTIFVFLFGILWFPLKRFLKSRKTKLKKNKKQKKD